MVLGYALVVFYGIFERIRIKSKFNSGLHMAEVQTKGLSIVISLLLVVRGMFKNEEKARRESLSFLVILLGLAPLSIFFGAMVQKSRESRLTNRASRTKNDREALSLIQELIHLVENLDSNMNRSTLEGYMKLNWESGSDTSTDDEGTNEKSEDQTIQEELVFNKKLGVKRMLTRERSSYGVEVTAVQKEEPAVLKEIEAGIKFIEITIKHAIKKHPRSISLKLLQAHYQFHILKLKYAPLYTLKEAQSMKPTFNQKVAIERLKLAIEAKEKLKQKTQSEGESIEISLLISFDDIFKKFMDSVAKAVQKNHEVWGELSKASPNGRKIVSSGISLLATDSEIRTWLTKLTDLKVRELYAYSVFAGYLKDVIHDERSLSDLYDTIEQLKKEQKILSMGGGDSGYQAKLASENLCIVQVSGDKDNFGEILKVSRSVRDLLGYSDKELVGEKVEKIIPEDQKERHQEMMKKFIMKESTKYIGKCRNLFALDKQDFLVYCELTLKLLPSFFDGIRLIGVMMKKEDDDENKFRSKKIKATEEEFDFNDEKINCFLKYEADTGEVLGVCRECENCLGLSPQMLKKDRMSFGSKLNLTSIAPEIVQKWNLGKLRSDEGLCCHFDRKAFGGIRVKPKDESPKHKNLGRTQKNLEGLLEARVAKSENYSSYCSANFEDGTSRESYELFEGLSEDLRSNDLKAYEIRVWLVKEENFGGFPTRTIKISVSKDDVEENPSILEEVEMKYLDIGHEGYTTLSQNHSKQSDPKLVGFPFF